MGVDNACVQLGSGSKSFGMGWDGMGRASSGNIDSGEKRGRGSLICDGDGSSCEVFRLFGD